jgi:glycosyltransferase involved in cell wall biosynthesis
MTATVSPPSPARATARLRPLRVAHVNANFTAGAGGITLREALALDPERYENAILAPSDGTMFDRAEEAGLPVVRLQQMGGGRHVYPWSDAAAVRELMGHLQAGEFDIVHTHGGRAGVIGRIAAHRLGVRALVHTLHGFPFTEFQRRPVRHALLTVERRLGRVTNYFLTDGTFIASEAVRLRIAPPERIRALISPIDHIPPVTEEGRRQARAVLGLPHDARIVGTVARLDKQKAPFDMVEAFVQLARPDVYMVWIGGGELREDTERLIREKGLEGRFLLLGQRDDVPLLLAGFDVFALSSRWEGLPCSVVEAMTCGVPVVANAVNSVPEIVIAGRTGLVARPAQPASLAGAIAYMLDHPEAAARMAAAARAHIGEQSRADLLGQELTEAYEAALTLPPRARQRTR